MTVLANEFRRLIRALHGDTPHKTKALQKAADMRRPTKDGPNARAGVYV
jgi:hypothetical protein